MKPPSLIPSYKFEEVGSNKITYRANVKPKMVL
jgi:hypothetical protein